MDGAQALTTPAETGLVPALSQRDKAAIVVRWLVSEGADFSLAALPVEHQLALTEAVADLPSVDKATLREVASEFTAALDALALGLTGGVDGALDLLGGRISEDAARRIRERAASRTASDPWDRLRMMEAETLLPVLEEESVEVGAVLISKLPVKTAAALLGRLPGARARRITYAVSMTSGVTPEAVGRIGASLVRQLEATPAAAFDETPDARVGAILNSADAKKRDELLGALEETDEQFAVRVRRAIFTFANIAARVEPTDVPTFVRAVDPATMVTALAAAEAAGEAEAASATFVLDNMSQRMAGQLRDEMEERGTIPGPEGEAAMSDVVAAIQVLAGERAIILRTVEDDGE